MKPSLRKKISQVKEQPDYMTRAKEFFNSVLQASVDNTKVNHLTQELEPERESSNVGNLAQTSITATHPLTEQLLKAQQWKETGGTFKPNLVSHKGAKGLAQIMDDTWEESKRKGWVDKNADVFDPKANAQAQYKIMEHLLQTETVRGDIKKALAAYNWGFGNLRKHLQKRGDQWFENLPNETRNYVTDILNYEKNLHEKGL